MKTRSHQAKGNKLHLTLDVREIEEHQVALKLDQHSLSFRVQVQGHTREVVRQHFQKNLRLELESVFFQVSTGLLCNQRKEGG